MEQGIRWLLLSDFTMETLAQILRKPKSGNPVIQCTVGPIDQVCQVIHDDNHVCWHSDPQVAVVWTQPFRSVPAFGRNYYEGIYDPEEIVQQVKEYARSIKLLASKVGIVIIASWTLPSSVRGNGITGYSKKTGMWNILSRMNLLLSEELESLTNIYLLPAESWLVHSSMPFHERMWFLGKIPYSREVFQAAAQDMLAVVSAVYGRNRKLVVLDLDNTLWGGIVGDDGIEGIAIGGIDPAGEAFADFQRNLLALKNRGVLLAIASKNEESTALDAIDRHPDMILRRSDFIAWSINWNDKARNIIQLAERVNLSLDAIVFLDDSREERERVKAALPEVLVPDWPEDPSFYSSALSKLVCFDMAYHSGEDSERTRYYREEASRKQKFEELSSVESWLESLKLTIACDTFQAMNAVRAVQLLNKTNQFNLVSRRMGQPEFTAFAEERDSRVFLFRLVDKFGDYGHIGLASAVLNKNQLHIEDFVLSCRAMGRGVENAMMYILAQYAGSCNIGMITAKYIATPKNKPCAHFLSDLGFIQSIDGGWTIPVKDILMPAHITENYSVKLLQAELED